MVRLFQRTDPERVEAILKEKSSKIDQMLSKTNKEGYSRKLTRQLKKSLAKAKKSSNNKRDKQINQESLRKRGKTDTR